MRDPWGSDNPYNLPHVAGIILAVDWFAGGADCEGLDAVDLLPGRLDDLVAEAIERFGRPPPSPYPASDGARPSAFASIGRSRRSEKPRGVTFGSFNARVDKVWREMGCHLEHEELKRCAAAAMQPREYTCAACGAKFLTKPRRGKKRCRDCRARAGQRRPRVTEATAALPHHKTSEQLAEIRKRQFADRAFTCALCEEEKPEGTRWVLKHGPARCFPCNAAERARVRRERKEAERVAAEAEEAAQAEAEQDLEPAEAETLETPPPAADPLGMMAFALDVQAALAAAEIAATPNQAVALAAVLSARGWVRA